MKLAEIPWEFQPPRSQKDGALEVTYEYGDDGILTVQIHDMHTGQKKRFAIQQSGQDQMDAAAKKYPNVYFEQATGFKTETNLAEFFAFPEILILEGMAERTMRVQLFQRLPGIGPKFLLRHVAQLAHDGIAAHADTQPGEASIENVGAMRRRAPERPPSEAAHGGCPEPTQAPGPRRPAHR